MIRSLTALACGSVAALGLTLATPQTAPAQSAFGLQLNVGPAGFYYQQGTPAVVAPPVAVAPVAPAVVVPYPAPYVYPRTYVPAYRPYYGWQTWRYPHHRYHRW